MADETPEKQLLKLIEQPHAGGSVSAATNTAGEAAAPIKPKRGLPLQSLLSPSGWKGLLSYAQEQGAGFIQQNSSTLGFKQFNQFLKIGITTAGVLMLVYLAYSAYDLKNEYDSLADPAQKQMADLPVSGGRMLDPNFFEDIIKRNIFTPSAKKIEPEVQDGGVSKAKVQEMTKDIKLTGISVNPRNDSRTFCMIEDLKKSVTSFLKVGDSINGFMVSKIDKDTVELTYQKETVELR